jgi:hypothetical protein
VDQTLRLQALAAPDSDGRAVLEEGNAVQLLDNEKLIQPRMSKLARLGHRANSFVALLWVVGFLLVLLAMWPGSNADRSGLPWAMVVGPLILVGVTAVWNRSRQARRDDIAAGIFNDLVSTKDPGCFGLYLRPFASRGLFEKPREFGGVFDAETDDLEGAIITSLSSKELPFLALGTPGEAVGAGRITICEDQWQPVVKLLCDRAAVIVLLLSARPGTQFEIEHILNHGHTEKTVFIGPPKLHSWTEAFQKSDGLAPSKEYERMRALFDRTDLVLPPWKSTGNILQFPASGPQSYDLGWPKKLNLAALRKCLEAARAPGGKLDSNTWTSKQ